MNNYEKEACLNILTSETGHHKPLVVGSTPSAATIQDNCIVSVSHFI